MDLAAAEKLLDESTEEGLMSMALFFHGFLTGLAEQVTDEALRQLIRDAIARGEEKAKQG